jgi:hypothetical protein
MAALDGSGPVLSTEMKVGATCRSAMVAVAHGRGRILAHVDQDLRGQPVAEGRDGTFWSIVDGRYFKFSATDEPAFVEPYTSGFVPAGIGSTDTGHVFAIESRDGARRVVDLETGNVFAMPHDGSAVAPRLITESSPYNAVDGLIRGSDGQLYFHFLNRTDLDCETIEISPFGKPLAKGPCGNLRPQVAVGRDGGIWVDAFKGILELGGAGTRVTFEATPCQGLSAVLLDYPSKLTADRLGNVWFLYGKLWHVDPVGRLWYIALPPDISVDSMLAANDGTLWLAGNRAVVHFRPGSR